MSTWHQQQAQRRAYEAGKPLKLNHLFLWTVRTDAPNRMASAMTWPTEAEAQQYLDNLQARAAEHPDDIERQLEAKHSYILAPDYTAEQKRELFYDVRLPDKRLGYCKKDQVERLLLELCGGGWTENQTLNAMLKGQELRKNGSVTVKGCTIGPVGEV